jgi:hypothetical protein
MSELSESDVVAVPFHDEWVLLQLVRTLTEADDFFA